MRNVWQRPDWLTCLFVGWLIDLLLYLMIAWTVDWLLGFSDQLYHPVKLIYTYLDQIRLGQSTNSESPIRIPMCVYMKPHAFSIYSVVNGSSHFDTSPGLQLYNSLLILICRDSFLSLKYTSEASCISDLSKKTGIGFTTQRRIVEIVF